MAGTIADYLLERDRLEAAARSLLAPRLPLLQRELGIPGSLWPDEIPAISLQGGGLSFEVPTGIAAKAQVKNKPVNRQVWVPLAAVEGTEEEAESCLRRMLPLLCSGCGIHHRAGQRCCTATLGCWGTLTWRSISPVPSFYVEPAGSWGYYESTASRGLRFAVDLPSREVYGIQVTPPLKEKWYEPAWATRDRIQEIAGTVAPELNQVIGGRLGAHAQASCLSLVEPAWCDSDSPRYALERRVSYVRWYPRIAG
jgi:hypothetical protein